MHSWVFRHRVGLSTLYGLATDALPALPPERSDDDGDGRSDTVPAHHVLRPHPPRPRMSGGPGGTGGIGGPGGSLS